MVDVLCTNPRGFTYVELLLVITLISLFAVSLSPSISISGGGIESATKKVVADLRYAQELATMNNQNYGIQFNANGAYILYQGTVATPFTDPLSQTSFSENLSRFKNVKISNTLKVEFDAMGRPALGSGSTVTLTNNVINRLVRITANTGFAEAL